MSEKKPIQPELTLISVRLDRFKAAYRMTKPILLHPFNAIIGRNGAGKSTVVEALQWVDTALRNDVRQASDRFNGIQYLVNHRTTGKSRHFKIELVWVAPNIEGSKLEYGLKVGLGEDGRSPVILEEGLALTLPSGRYTLITTQKGVRRLGFVSGDEAVPFPFRDRLALGTAFARETPDEIGSFMNALREFWFGAVFLRLSPNELAKASPATRASYAPLLDETGKNLPALLKDFTKKQISELISIIQLAMPDFSDIEVSRPMVPSGDIYFSLVEMMPSRGRSGRKGYPIPSWMLSEGTRRITAILSLLQSIPPPTFLCIEEIENGLDYATVLLVLAQLRSASNEGIQVLATTHSIWLLDEIAFEDIIYVERVEGITVYSRFADKASLKDYKDQVPPGTAFAREL